MSTVQTTGSQQTLWVSQDFGKQIISAKSVNGNTFYVGVTSNVDASSITIRVSEASITTSAVDVDEKKYTVPDGTLFRGNNELVPVFSSGGTQKGSICVKSISGNDVYFEYTGEVYFVPEAGDTLLLRADNFIEEGDFGIIDCSRHDKVVLLSSSSDVLLVCDVLDTDIKKKI